MSKIIPVSDNLLIVPEVKEEENKTNSGILLVNEEKNTITNIAKVLEVGEGRLLNDGSYAKLNFDKGDRVIYNSFAGTEVDMNGQLALIIKANDIIAKIK